MSKPPKIFIAYSHRNRAEKDELEKSLSIMEQKKEIKIWHDNEMLPGGEWRETISKRLAESDILLYLVSSYSLASKNLNIEMAKALGRGKKAIPIILEDCDWQAHELSSFQVLPDNGKPINRWEPRSDGWQNVVAGIRKTVEAMQKAKAEPPPDEQEIRRNLPLLLFQQANFLYMLRQFDQAIQAYSGVIEASLDDAAAYNNRGGAYLGKGEYDRAIADYDKAIALNPDYADAYNNRGVAYSDKSDYARAIVDYDKAIALKPDLAEAYRNRGNAYAAKDDSVRAIADYDKAIALKPDSAEAYYNRGNTYFGKEDYDRAIEDYDEAIARKSGLAKAYNNRASA